MTFIDFTTPVPADWLNNVNSFVNTIDISKDVIISSISQLRLISHAQHINVFVTGYYSVGDGGGGRYYYNSSDTTSPDNGGTIIVANDGGRWYLNHQGKGVSVKQFGAVGDGVTDDAATIQAALNSMPVGGTIWLTPGTYRVSTGIIVPNGVCLKGISAASGATVGTPSIIGDLNVSTILTINAGLYIEIPAASNFTVTRAPGTIPALSVGVNLKSFTSTATIQGICSYRSETPFLVGGDVSTSLGGHLFQCETGQATGHHIKINNVVEVSCTECRFGQNGGGDLVCTAYVNIDGAIVDTVRFTTCQFNQSGGAIVGLMHLTGYANDPNGIITLAQCHAEGWSTYVVGFDAGSTNIKRIRFVGNTINGTGQLINGAAGQVSELDLVGNLFGGAVTLTLDQQVNSIVTGNIISGATTINQGSQVVTGNFFYSNVILEGVSVRTVFVGNAISGTLTNTMTGTAVVANNG